MEEGREPEDSQESAGAGVSREAGRVEGQGVPEDVDVVRAPEEARQVGVSEVAEDLNLSRVPERARRLERPGVSRDVSMVRGLDEDQVGILEEGGRRIKKVRVQETETGEESGLSGEISELAAVPKGKVPGRSKGKRRNRQHELEEQAGGQQNQESHLGQPRQDREEYLEPYLEGTGQRYRSRTMKHKGLVDSLMGRRRKIQAKYRLERKPSLRSSAGSLAQGHLCLAPGLSLAPGSSLTPGSSLAAGSSLAPRVSPVPSVSLVPRKSLAPQVSLGLGSQRSSASKRASSTWYQEPELEYRRPTIRFSLRPKTSRRLSQRSDTPCVSLIGAFNELAKMGDPDLLEMVEEEGRTAGWR